MKNNEWKSLSKEIERASRSSRQIITVWDNLHREIERATRAYRPIATATDQMRDAIESVSRMYRPITTTADEMREVIENATRVCRPVTTVADEMHKAIESGTRAYRSILAELDRMNEAIENTIHVPKSISIELAEVHEIIERAAHGPRSMFAMLAQTQESIESTLRTVKMTDTLSLIQENTAAISHYISNALSAISWHQSYHGQDNWINVFQNLNFLIKENAVFDSDVVEEGDELIVNGELVTKTELREALSGIEADFKQYSEAECAAAVGRALMRIADARKLSLKRILLAIFTNILLPLMLSVVGNRIYDTLRSPGQKPRQLIERSIREEVKARRIPRSVTCQLRYVSTDVLRVRAKNAKKTRLIGKLYLGQIVEVLDRRKNWSHVIWRNEANGLAIEGWVFSRYLRRIDSKKACR